MRMIFPKAALGLALALGALAVAETGCARHAAQTAEQTQAAQAGAEMQASGTMTQADYVRVRGQGHSVARTHTISDADLGWTVAFLQGAGNSIARARAMTVLSEIRPMTPAQRARIAPAVAPFLNSPDHLDSLGAQRVQRALQAAS